MTTEKDRREDAADCPTGSGPSLRMRAEERTGAVEAQDMQALAPEEATRVLHDLRVHQIELEIQNEELRRTQELLEASRARYFDLYDLAPIGYVTLSEQGLILEANLRAATLLGAPRGGLIKQPLSRSIVPEDQDIFYRHCRRLFATREPQVCELRMSHQGSTPFWVRLEAIAGRDGETGMPVSRTMISDITERKRAEEEREKLQAQLAQAQKMESVGRLAGGVAHDFNNLLTVINGYSALLASGMKLGDPVRTSAEAIIAAGESAASLVRQLLAFSRQQALSPKALNLNDVVASAESMLRRLVGENVDLLTDLGSGLDFVVADPHMLEQVIVNLAVNARDAMPHGGLLMIATTQVEHGSLCPTCGERVTPGRYVRLTVRDTGTGFDETVRSHLFEPFFTTKEAGEGTGLGLATAQGIVRQSGGHIHAESVPGKGAAFDVYLPAVDREPNVVERGEVTAQETGGSETILVVEDQAEVRRFIGTLLASYGYRVLQASGAEEALALCATSHVDLLLTDVVMPGISGPELAAGALVLRPRMKTLFMSGYSGDTVLRDGPDPPADAAFIQKPFTPRELAVDVRRVLGRSSE